jgi:hypothetical protein
MRTVADWLDGSQNSVFGKPHVQVRLRNGEITDLRFITTSWPPCSAKVVGVDRRWPMNGRCRWLFKSPHDIVAIYKDGQLVAGEQNQ